MRRSEPLGFFTLGGYDAPHQRFLFEMMGYKAGDRILAMDGSTVPPEARDQNVYWVRKSGRELPYGSIGLSSQYLTSQNVGHYVDFIRHLKPSFIRGYPSFINTISQYVLENGIKFDFSFKGIELTSESHFDYQVGICQVK